ncbi:hypothetical protein [Thermomonas fusca]|uniref:Nuclear transport factor 2 family protein n=1 Tax=Thermomonas fusca TaxID=215690 RepID=A0A5R9PG16_9GAMM|nr:hypothetical protein [Thermomonas fusca]TLX21963.1 hypothetical protein E5S66_05380 [Thermomonas fusca]
MHRFRLLSAVLLAALLVACGDREPAGEDATLTEESLPKPEANGGSATGMPAPRASTPDPGRVEDAQPAPATPSDGIAPSTTDASTAQTEPGVEAAVAVLRDYYAAINARDFARAHALWRQNPQTAAQFADGFAGTTGVSVEIGAPGPIDAGAGQRFIEIPVKLAAGQSDGRIDHYTGRYVLHRSVVEGGDPGWRIERATLAKQ